MDKEIVKSMREAIKQGNLDLVKKLNVDNEGLINADTIFGSWLHVASAHGQINIVEYLIKCGLDVNQNGDISGGTPVRSAAENGHLDIIKRASRLFDSVDAVVSVNPDKKYMAEWYELADKILKETGKLY